MTRVLDVETVLTFIVPGVQDRFSWVLISRHLISGYLLATCSALKQPLPCTIIRVDASTRPGPPPRGASARTFLLPAPGNHASSSFLTLLTPSFRVVINIYLELLALLTFHSRDGFVPPRAIFISSLISLLEFCTLYALHSCPPRLFHPRSFRHQAITSGMPSYAIHHISLLRK